MEKNTVEEMTTVFYPGDKVWISEKKNLRNGYMTYVMHGPYRSAGMVYSTLDRMLTNKFSIDQGANVFFYMEKTNKDVTVGQEEAINCFHNKMEAEVVTHQRNEAIERWTLERGIEHAEFGIVRRTF